ncbi:MAG: class II aldolase/adducin family protein [Alphaproteobacteria bacterium]|nr:class II aldolase/adducin family protein [Alphaproteobacteria bacterium]
MALDQPLSFPAVRDQVSAAEWRVRVDLAALYRLVAHYGWDDLVFTHLSARVPGPEQHFLINPYGLMFDEITASSLVKVDLEGNVVLESPYGVNAAGFVIHSAIHMAREDAHAVIHLHTDDGTAVSAQKDGLLMITQTAMNAGYDLAYHDYEGIAFDFDERERLVADLGAKTSMILRNHGTLTVGRTCAEAFVRIFGLERACTMQVRALAGGVAINWPAPGAAEKVAQQNRQSSQMAGDETETYAAKLAWPALMRRLDKLDPSFRD